MTGNQKTEIASPRRFAARLAEIPVQSDRKSLAEIYSLPVMQQVRAMQELGESELSALDDLEAACNQEIARLLQNYKPSSVSSLLTRYKTVLAEMGYRDHPYTLYFKMPNDLQRELKSEYQGRVTAENRSLRAFWNHEQYLMVAQNLMKDARSYMKIAMGLCAVTGRRPGEILATAKFEKTSHDRIIKFSGQLKTKGSDQGRDNYEIPVLCDADEIVDALARLRDKKDLSTIPVQPGKTLGQAVNLRTSKQQNETVRQYFSQYFEGKITAYSLRPAYALIAADRYKPETITGRAYFAEILGHSEDDTATAASYEDFYLKKN